MLLLPAAHYSGHVLAFLSVRDIVSFATTSRQALAASLPTLRRIQNSLFFDRALLLSASSSLKTKWPPQQHPPTLFTAPVYLSSFTTLYERIQVLAELIPSKYSNRAKIQALRAALSQQLRAASSVAVRRRQRQRQVLGTSSCPAITAATTSSASGHDEYDDDDDDDDDEYKNDKSNNNGTARRMRELQSLLVPFRLLHQLTWSFSPVVRRRHLKDDDDDDDDPMMTTARRTCSSSSSSSNSGSCLLDDYLGDVYVVLYLLLSVPWSASSSPQQQQRRQQQDWLHRIIGEGTLPLPGQKRSNIDNNQIGADNGDDTTITFAARYGDWVYWHAQWLTRPGLLTVEQRVRFGVWAAMDRHDRHHEDDAADMAVVIAPSPAVQRAMTPTTTPPPSVLTLVYDDFAPLMLGLPHFRGRDIVRMLDVSAALMMMNDEDPSSSSSSTSSLAVIREWIVSAHEQALSHRPMTVRPPEVRFG
jgi:hypothetical protein